MTTRIRRHSGATALLAITVAVLAACGSDDPNTDSPSESGSPGAGSSAQMPPPAGELTPFLSAIDSAGGCSDALTEAVTRGVGALNVYGTNGHGDAKVTGSTGREIAGVPSCEFTISPGNTMVPTNLVIGGLPTSKNMLVAEPAAPTMEPDNPMPETSTPEKCDDLGVDRVAAAAQELIDEAGVSLDCSRIENRSASGILTAVNERISISGATATTFPVDGYFVAAQAADAPTENMTSEMAGVFKDWIQRGSTASTPNDFKAVLDRK